MPSSTASASSRSVLPTPENMIFSGATPAARARNSSPSETTSAPAPSRASVAITAWLELALSGVADERVDVGEGAGEHPVVPLQGRARIAVERGADRLGQRDQIDGLGAEHAVAIGEVMHGACLEHQPEEWKPGVRRERCPDRRLGSEASVRPGGAESRTATAAAGRGEMASSGPAWPQDCRAGRSRSWQWSPAKSAALRMHRQAQKRPARGAARSRRPGPVESLSVRAEFQGSRCARRRTGSEPRQRPSPKAVSSDEKPRATPRSLVTA